MRIAMDARPITAPYRRAAGRNLLDLYRHLISVRPRWEVLAYHRELLGQALPLPQQQVQPQQLDSSGSDEAWARHALPYDAKVQGAGVLHCTPEGVPDDPPFPVLLNIHDLTPMDGQSHWQGGLASSSNTFRAVPTKLSPQDQVFCEQAEQCRADIARACRLANAIVCPSVSIRDRLIETFEVDPAHITVIANAADEFVLRSRRIKLSAFVRHRIKRQFVLHFGSDHPRNNTQRLLEAWALTGRANQKYNQLLIVGLSAEAQAHFRNVSRRLCIADSVLLHQYVSDDDLATMWHGARALAYPSLSEGFGQPILDAWATDTPVLAGHIDALCELGGDAAAFANPMDPCSIARHLSQVIRERPLRTQLKARGKARLRNFSWRNAAERFARLLEKVATQEPGQGVLANRATNTNKITSTSKNASAFAA